MLDRGVHETQGAQGSPAHRSVQSLPATPLSQDYAFGRRMPMQYGKKKKQKVLWLRCTPSGGQDVKGIVSMVVLLGDMEPLLGFGSPVETLSLFLFCFLGLR